VLISHLIFHPLRPLWLYGIHSHNQNVAQLPARHVSRRGIIKQLAVLLV
jgi:hypothetical protein